MATRLSAFDLPAPRQPINGPQEALWYPSGYMTILEGPQDWKDHKISQNGAPR